MEEQQTIKMKTEKAKDLPLIDEGDYNAKVTRIETDQEGRFGKMLKIYFDVVGVEVSALCSQKLNPKTKLFGWASLLRGTALKEGEDLTLTDLVGKEALVTVRNKTVKDETGAAKLDDDGNTIKTSNVVELRKSD